MVARRRRSYRKQLSLSPTDSAGHSLPLSPSCTDENIGDRDLQITAPSGDASADLCPACKKDDSRLIASLSKESWVRCDSCKTWYHWRCVGEGDDLSTLDKW